MRKYIEKVLDFAEKKKKFFFTFHLRPESSNQVDKKSQDNHVDTAIIIQGPIIRERNFTLETVKIYKKIFPGVSIVLSTWEDEGIEIFKNLDIEILLNKKPENPGICHINYQIVSVKNGLSFAKKHDVTYVLKTRTDQRIYNIKALSYYKDLIKAFPIESTKKAKGRIIATDINTFTYRPYSISDMTLFGFFEDMNHYWNIELDPRSAEDPSFAPHTKNISEYIRCRICEVFLATNYLKKMGEEIQWTMADGWKQYVDYFSIADRSTIDLYWFKYDKHKEYRKTRYDGDFVNEEFSFTDWLKLYNSQNFKDAPEEILFKQMGEKR